MNLTPLLVVLSSVITAYGHRPTSYTSRIEFDTGVRRQRQIEPQYGHAGRRDDHPRPYNSSQVVLTARGLVPQTFLPRYQDGSLNLDVIAEYAEFLVHNDIKAVLILGNDGEGPALSIEDRKRVVDEWVRVGKMFGLHIMVQVGGVPYPEVIAMARYSQAAGADSILTLPEVYYKPGTLEELLQYIAEVGKAAPLLPVLYYHFPRVTGVDFPPPLIVRNATALVPNFRGIKYHTDDLGQLTATLNELQHGQELFFTADRLNAPAALLGVRSAMCASVNIWPLLLHDIFDAVEQSDVKRAQQLQEKLTLGDEAILAASSNPTSALKAAMEIVTGITLGPPGRPLPLVTNVARNRMERQLLALGLAYKPTGPKSY